MPKPDIKFSSDKLDITAEAEKILQKIADGERDLVQKFIDKYGDLIWQAANNLTGCRETAEMLTQNVFRDVWKCCDRIDFEQVNEEVYIISILKHHIEKLHIQERKYTDEIRIFPNKISHIS